MSPDRELTALGERLRSLRLALDRQDVPDVDPITAVLAHAEAQLGGLGIGSEAGAASRPSALALLDEIQALRTALAAHHDRVRDAIDTERRHRQSHAVYRRVGSG